MTPEQLTHYRILFSLAGIALAFGFGFFCLREDRVRRGVYTALLIAVACGALYFHFELGPQFKRTELRRVMNPHDFYHYYIGSKYFDELGYYDLYHCSVVADQQGARRVRPSWPIRVLRTYRLTQASHYIDNPDRCAELFTAARWESFRSDVAAMSELMPASTWSAILQDKGYNATPVWNAYAAPLANAIPLSRTSGVALLLGLDWIYTALIFVAAGWAFGRYGVLFTMVFWGVNYMASTYFVKGSYSRLDWLAAVILALCSIRKGHWRSAGVFAGLATALRLFPVLFLTGLVAKAGWAVIRTRKLPQRYVQFFAAAGVTVLLLSGFTLLTSTGRTQWTEFRAKISAHDSALASYRVGFKYALLDAEEMPASEAKVEFESGTSRAVWLATQVLMLGGVFLAARRLEDHRTLGLSFVCVFFLTAPTFYYYQMLVVPFMIFIPDGRRTGLAWGMSGFFAWNVLAYGMALKWPIGFTLSHWLSWSVFGLCVMILLSLLAQHGQSRLEDPPESGASR